MKRYFNSGSWWNVGFGSSHDEEGCSLDGRRRSPEEGPLDGRLSKEGRLVRGRNLHDEDPAGRESFDVTAEDDCGAAPGDVERGLDDDVSHGEGGGHGPARDIAWRQLRPPRHGAARAPVQEHDRAGGALGRLPAGEPEPHSARRDACSKVPAAEWCRITRSRHPTWPARVFARGARRFGRAGHVPQQMGPARRRGPVPPRRGSARSGWERTTPL